MIPTEPSEPAPVWTEARRRIEIVTRSEHAPAALSAVERETNNRVHRFVLRRCGVGVAPDDDASARFGRSPFDPVDTCAVERGHTQADRAAHDQVRSDR